MMVRALEHGIDRNRFSIEALPSAILGVYAVLFFWDAWTIGAEAFQIDATIFLYGVAALFAVNRAKEQGLKLVDLSWIGLTLAIGLSYCLYDESFFKNTTFYVFPVLFLWHLHASSEVFNKRSLTSRSIFLDLVNRSFISIFRFLIPAWRAYTQFRVIPVDTPYVLIKRIATGVVTLVVVTACVMPLLYGVDETFSIRLDLFVSLLVNSISWILILKIICAIAVAVFFLAACYAHRSEWTPPRESPTAHMDSVISGIVLSGILVIYLFLIGVQAEKLWFDGLLFDGAELIVLENTGFWQLIALSMFNVTVFGILYRKTNLYSQIVLSIFVAASIVILGLIALKIYLHVVTYGLYYRAFYASYAVLYCGLLSIILFMSSIKKTVADVVRGAILLFTIMYSLLALMPVAEIMSNVNVVLRAP
tara:strand:+ start:6156 stop:7415 length:1260 start_codon:yes stop_codon:yes gene_type:complete